MSRRLGSDGRPAHDIGPFAHASEAEFARILDFYEVSWRYEPDVFPILWDLDGNVVESFAPDFYLPEMDLYVELTTLQQRLVRKKNRKVRRLRELYPGIAIKLFYARDFRALMLKYGLARLIHELSGTIGQVGPRGGRPDEHETLGTLAVSRGAHAAEAHDDRSIERPSGLTLDGADRPALLERPSPTHPISIGRSRAARRRAARRSRNIGTPLES